MSNLPAVLVHQSDIGEGASTSEKRKSSRNITIDPVAIEVGKLKKNGKPSRRWLAKQLESLKLQNTNLIKSLRIKEENELRLTEIRARLENELQHYRCTAAEKPTQKLRMTILSQDLFILKNLVVKLNKELQKYQDKFGSKLSISDGISGQYKTVHPKWIDGELTLLAPLLVAFEENIKEKEQLVNDTTEKLLIIGNECKELIKENEDLRSAIKESSEKGDVNYADWQVVHKENLLYKEQNQLLLRQTKLNQCKLQHLKEGFQSKLDEVVLERDDFLDKLQHSKTELSILKGRFSAMAEEFERLKREDSGKISYSVHTAYITECRRLFEELKQRYEEDRKLLLRNITDTALGKSEAENDLSQLRNEKEIVREKLVLLSEEVKLLKDNLQKLTRENNDLRRQLNSTLDFSKELISQEETLLRELHLRTEEANLGSKLAGRVENLKRNMKNVEIDTLQQMQAIDKDLENQVKCVGKIKESFIKEITRLKQLLHQRDFKSATDVAKKEEYNGVSLQDDSDTV